ncbi:hypothetical protein [Jidongwangia harbinensis]|uniref:hypothetical protein n=1 Tax=Jidongwangia harbinensis TaxID=2878561 RepID=UPI001CDA47CB|nr:hypothetical protein [Jidongwangia harbinensis]MCA2215685.1 hypothetical protein [Jidongwangia harbinensis]
MTTATVWIGGDLPAYTAERLREMAAASPGRPRELWIHPADGPRMPGVSAMANQAGFAVRDLMAAADDLARVLPRDSGYTGQTLRDIWTYEMRAHGEVSVKDMAVFLVGARTGDVITDLSVRPSPGADGLRGGDLTFPMIDAREDAVLYSAMDQGGNPYDLDNDDALIPMPKIDIWAFQVRPGGPGQQVMGLAAKNMIDRYFALAQQDMVEGKAVVRPEDVAQGRFLPTGIQPGSRLAEKANPASAWRISLTGELAAHAFYDAYRQLRGVAGQNPNNGAPMRVVTPEQWARDSWSVAQPSENVRVAADAGLTKTLENSWKREALARISAATMQWDLGSRSGSRGPTPSPPASLRRVSPPARSPSR